MNNKIKKHLKDFKKDLKRMEHLAEFIAHLLAIQGDKDWMYQVEDLKDVMEKMEISQNQIDSILE